METIIRKKSTRSNRRIINQIIMIGFIQIATIFMMAWNIMLYKGPFLTFAWISVIAVSAMLYYTISMVTGINNINSQVNDLSETIRRKLQFYRAKYSLFIIFAGITILIMNMAISMLMDHRLGGYQIHHPIEFTLVQLVAFGIVYISFKFSAKYTFEEYTRYLEDLESDLFEIGEKKYSDIKRRHRITIAVLFIIVLSLFVITLFIWLI